VVENLISVLKTILLGLWI